MRLKNSTNISLVLTALNQLTIQEINKIHFCIICLVSGLPAVALE